LTFELEISVNHTIEELIGCVRPYFRTLKALHENGSTVLISMDIEKLKKTNSPGPLASRRPAISRYMFRYPVSTATFEDFRARLKQVN
jgi:hypothetical protein